MDDDRADEPARDPSSPRDGLTDREQADVESVDESNRTPPSSEGRGETETGSGRLDEAADDPGQSGDSAADQDVPADVRSYERFQKIDGGTYERANDFLRERTYITAREWAIARLCADFRTETGVEMTKIGENLPELVPFMTDTYTPQAVNQARASFEEKVRMAGSTFLYGAMSDFFTADELDEIMYETTEVAKFLLEVEGVELSVDEELEAEDQISDVMREVREHSAALRHDEVECPECGHAVQLDDA
ncbi:DUF5806 family protein [Halorhabdus salina]|uniref:DUF5806 family protein n=1 Tax=Halorhabdus salina TaxID=2750670 RepID=UPI00215D7A7E|nr:DUF5806 family protein [Halorhabdus salina]